MNSQEFESYVPVYDTVPEKWEDAREFLVEHLKKMSNAINVREIGLRVEEEHLSGQQFIPTAEMVSNRSSDSQQFRSVLRKVIDCSPLVIGANNFAHNIVFNANFTLMHLYAAATDSVAFVATPIPNGADTITMDATNLIITSAAAYDRCFAVVEYIQEV